MSLWPEVEGRGGRGKILHHQVLCVRNRLASESAFRRWPLRVVVARFPSGALSKPSHTLTRPISKNRGSVSAITSLMRKGSKVAADDSATLFTGGGNKKKKTQFSIFDRDDDHVREVCVCVVMSTGRITPPPPPPPPPPPRCVDTHAVYTLPSSHAPSPPPSLPPSVSSPQTHTASSRGGLQELQMSLGTAMNKDEEDSMGLMTVTGNAAASGRSKRASMVSQRGASTT